MVYDVAIIGSGPAGLTAGIYSITGQIKHNYSWRFTTRRALTTTTVVENWPGDISIMGLDLMMKMRDHAQHYGCKLEMNLVVKVDFENKPCKLHLDNGQIIQANSVIIATGASHKQLGCPGKKSIFPRAFQFVQLVMHHFQRYACGRSWLEVIRQSQKRNILHTL